MIDFFTIPNFISIGKTNQTRNRNGFHKHHFWEILFYTEGIGRVEFKGDPAVTFQPGTIIGIPPHLVHRDNPEEGFQNIFLAIEEFQSSKIVPVFQETVQHPVFLIATILNTEFHWRKKSRELIVRNLFETVMAYLREWQNIEPHDMLLFRLERRICNNVANSEFSISKAIMSIPLSVDHARRLFKHRTGLSPRQYLIDLRMKRAKELLQIGFLVKEVAQQVAWPRS